MCIIIIIAEVTRNYCIMGDVTRFRFRMSVLGS